MHLSTALTIFLSMHCSSSHAFQSSPYTKKTFIGPLSMSDHFRTNSPEWDNDDFLESLSGTPGDREEANRKYKEQSERNEKLRDMMASFREKQQREGGGGVDPPPLNSPSEEEVEEGMQQPGERSGGEKFRRMMETRQRFAPPSSFMRNEPPQQEKPPQQQQPPLQQPPPEEPTPTGQQQQPPPQQKTPATSFPQAPQLDDEPVVFMTQDGKVGRNRDADKIANTADMYFAQLKLDSKIRKRAFLQGDTETSNKVFGDERVQKLPDELAENPFVKANLNRSKADDTLGTSAEESLGPFIFTAQDKPFTAEQKRSSGVSYKQKLLEKKKKTTTAQPAKDETATPPPPPPATAVSTPPPAQQQTPTNEDESRVKFRTLQGLIIKHKGGPGFGAGRLKAPEAQKLEQLVGEVTALLKSEAGIVDVPYQVEAATALPAIQPPQVEAPPAPSPIQPRTQVKAKVATLPARTPIQPVEAPSPTQEADDPLESYMEDVRLTLRMYRDASSPQERKEFLTPLSLSLTNAVLKLDELIDYDTAASPQGTAAAPPQDKIEFPETYNVGTVEEPQPKVEETPPATSVAEATSATPTVSSTTKTMEQPQPKVEATSVTSTVVEETSTTPTVSTTTKPLEKPQPTVEEAPSATAAPLTTNNDEFFKCIYSSLNNAAGDGALGLKSSLSKNEAEKLADSLTDMKSILLDELNVTPTPSSSTEQQKQSDDAPTQGGSKYQDMLAKAKAAKQNKS